MYYVKDEKGVSHVITERLPRMHCETHCGLRLNLSEAVIEGSDPACKRCAEATYGQR